MKQINLPRSFEVTEIIENFESHFSEFKGIEKVNVQFVTSFNTPCNNAVMWVGSDFFLNEIDKVNKLEECLIITDFQGDFYSLTKNAVLVTPKPKLLFIKILNHLFTSNSQPKIHPTAVIHNEANIGKNVSIGPNVIVGIASIGDNCILEGNVVIYDNVNIGKNVKIQSGAVLGSGGMSLSRDEDGSLIGFPCLGKVVIEDDVEIGSNCVIDQSIMEETRIGKGTKINSLTFIGNSVIIGENNYISVVVNINGSVHIGNNNFIGSGSTLRNKVVIGNENTIGAGAVVVKNVGNGSTMVGNPAILKSDLKNLKL